jgi:hypothetical protein
MAYMQYQHARITTKAKIEICYAHLLTAKIEPYLSGFSTFPITRHTRSEKINKKPPTLRVKHSIKPKKSHHVSESHWESNWYSTASTSTAHHIQTPQVKKPMLADRQRSMWCLLRKTHSGNSSSTTDTELTELSMLANNQHPPPAPGTLDPGDLWLQEAPLPAPVTVTALHRFGTEILRLSETLEAQRQNNAGQYENADDNHRRTAATSQSEGASSSSEPFPSAPCTCPYFGNNGSRRPPEAQSKIIIVPNAARRTISSPGGSLRNQMQVSWTDKRGAVSSTVAQPPIRRTPTVRYSDRGASESREIVRAPQSNTRQNSAFRNSSRHGRILMLEQKATKVLGVVFFTFVVLWAPFFVLNLVPALCSKCEKYISSGLIDFVTWLGYASSMVNPIFYTIFNKVFRQAFNKVLMCRYRNRIAK